MLRRVLHNDGGLQSSEDTHPQCVCTWEQRTKSMRHLFLYWMNFREVSNALPKMGTSSRQKASNDVVKLNSTSNHLDITVICSYRLFHLKIQICKNVLNVHLRVIKYTFTHLMEYKSDVCFFTAYEIKLESWTGKIPEYRYTCK